MANTQLSDIIDVIVFQDLPAVNSPERTAFYESGIITRSGLLDQLAMSDAKTSELPFWNDLDETSLANISTSLSSDTAAANAVTQAEQIARKLFLNKGWAVADLASELAMGPLAMNHIRNRTDKYWMRQWQRYLIGATNGVLADNVANNDGDMVIDVAADAIADQTTATKFSRSNFTSAAFTMGDAWENTGAIGVHSMIYKQMVDQDDIDFIPDSQGTTAIPTYMGKRVIVDDSMTVTAGTTDGFKYTSVLYGEGAFGFGEGTPTVPVAVSRDEELGNGGGIETLWTRKTYLLHPFGYQYTGTPASVSPSQAEYAEAASWSRVVERKNVPLAFLVTN